MQSQTAVFTICSNNYLSQAGVFFDTAREHLPSADLFLGLADVPDEAAAAPDAVQVVRADQLGISEFARMAFGYDIMEFNTAIKPSMFLRLFERGYRHVLYFDPDIMVFNPLPSVVEALDRGASFVLTPHFCVPPGVAAARTEIDVMRSGVYNLGFLACSAQPETETVLRWWARKLLHDCLNDQGAGLFVDQKFMDLVPGFTDHAAISRDPSLNVAYWNLAQRHVERRDTGWSVDGRPLGFFHFSGFDPRVPARLSKHVHPAPLLPAVLELLTLYAERLLARPGRARTPYAYAVFTSGTPIPPLARRMYREHQPMWTGDPFETYEDHLRRPSPHATLGRSGEIVTNLMQRVHDISDEARARFDLHNRHHVSLYLDWFRENAHLHGIAGSLLQPT